MAAARADRVVAIEELAAAKAELQRRQSFTDALLETVEVGIVSCDALGGSITSNRSARSISGVPGGPQILSQEETTSVLDALDMDGHPVSAEDYPLIRALRGEDVGTVEMLLGPVGGPHHEFITHSVRILDPDGVVIGAVSAMADVSAERIAARALAEAQRLGQIGSFELDFAHRDLDLLCAAVPLWGVAPEGLTADTFLGLIPEEDRAHAEQDPAR